MKARLLLSLGLLGSVVAFSFVAIADDADAKKKEFKASCPLSGKAALEDKFVKVHGKKVYFCCNNCPKTFQAKAKDHTLGDEIRAKVSHQFLQTGQLVQVACPFTGKPVNADTVVGFKGAKVGFCCNNCKGKFAKASDDQKLILAFAKKAVHTGFTAQTKCPVSGKPIVADKFVEHDGKKIYLCCPGCESKTKADAHKILVNIVAASLSFRTGSCCDKAQDNGKVCGHGCCAEAIEAGKVCKKCNG